MKLLQRLSALEKHEGSGLPHVVLWFAGRAFDECLADSHSLHNPADRMLIEVNFFGSTLTDAEQAERAKAYAWADELEAA